MTLQELQGKNIAVVGLGVEGFSSASYLASKGANVTVFDQKEEGEFDNDQINELKVAGVDFVFGQNYLENLDQFEMIVRSPGVKRNLKEITEAEKKGTEITSQTKIFFDLCPGKIIGVTGTKGKGTTTTLVYEMLKKEGKDVYLGGNIGKPPFDFLDTLTPQSIVVLELSSFQLEDITKSPHIAVVLMITSEHLGKDTLGTQNYHEDIAAYVAAKRNILTHQSSSDFAILNRDYPATNESDIHTEAKVFYVSREREVEEGCFVKDGKIMVRGSQVPQVSWGETARGTRGTLDTRDTFSIIDTKDILLPGAHNLENVCAAVMAAMLAGVSKEDIAFVLKTFKGLEHRLELVGEVDGVKYYDDSFSTTPETAIAAIQAFKNPEVIILGGSRKGSDFSELGKVIVNAKNIRAIIGIGVEWERIKEEISKYNPNIFMIEGAKDMPTIIQAAAKIAQPVLLSPACASFDMFKNYKERGNLFKKEVKKLQK